MGLPAKLSITNSNYVGYGKDVESWETVRISQNLPILKGASVSMDIGVREYTEFKPDRTHNCTISPAFEAKYKQKFTDNARGYIRYRNFGTKEQWRISAGGSVPLNNNLSLYGDVHGTVTQSLDYEKNPNYKTGGWIGIDYNCPNIKGLNIWCEPLQINSKIGELKPNESRVTFAGNCGMSYSF